MANLDGLTSTYDESNLFNPSATHAVKKIRLRAVFYFSLQSYCTRAAKPRAARNEGVSPRRKNESPSFLAWSQSLIVIITSWFAIGLDEVRTRQILREKANCKKSIKK